MIREKIQYALELVGKGKADRKMRSFSDGLEKESRKSQGALDGITNRFGRVGVAGAALASGGLALAAGGFVAVGVAIKKAISVAADFEQRMAEVQAITGAVGAEFQQLSELAREMGRTTKFSATEAADGIKFLGMAGFNTNQILEALPATLNLASAGAIGLGEAADISSNIMSGMGLQASDLSHVVDGLAQVARSSNVDVRGLGEAFKYVAPLAAGAKVSFDQSAAAVGILGNAGLQAGIAGRNLAGAITQILKPSAEAAALMKELGLSFKDPATGAINLADVLVQLENKAVSTEQMLTLFGVEGGRAIMAMAGQGSQALAKLQASVENADGVARRMAETQERTLSGAMRTAKSATESLAISVGSKFVPALTTALNDGVIPAVRWLGDLAEGFRKTGIESDDLTERFGAMAKRLKELGEEGDTLGRVTRKFEEMSAQEALRTASLDVSLISSRISQKSGFGIGKFTGTTSNRRDQAVAEIEKLTQAEIRAIEELENARSKEEVERLNATIKKQQELREELFKYIEALKTLEDAERRRAEIAFRKPETEAAPSDTRGRIARLMGLDVGGGGVAPRLDMLESTPEQRAAREVADFKRDTGVEMDVGIRTDVIREKAFEGLADDFVKTSKDALDRSGKKAKEVFGEEIPKEMDKIKNSLLNIEVGLSAAGIESSFLKNAIGLSTSFNTASRVLEPDPSRPGALDALSSDIIEAFKENDFLSGLSDSATKFARSIEQFSVVGGVFANGIQLFRGAVEFFRNKSDIDYTPDQNVQRLLGFQGMGQEQLEGVFRGERYALQEINSILGVIRRDARERLDRGEISQDQASLLFDAFRPVKNLEDFVSRQLLPQEILNPLPDSYVALAGGGRNVQSGSQSFSSVSTVTEATANQLISVNESIRIEIQLQTNVLRQILTSSQNIEFITAQSSGMRFNGFAGVN